jgi:uncharacterized protein YjbI with pentapeptide repeats
MAAKSTAKTFWHKLWQPNESNAESSQVPTEFSSITDDQNIATVSELAKQIATQAHLEQFNRLQEGAQAWNTWRQENPETDVELLGIKCSLVSLSGVNFSDADLRQSQLVEADLSGANFVAACLIGINLYMSNLSGTDFRGADLRLANLGGTDLRGADLRLANLSGADLRGADLRGADLSLANLCMAVLSGADLRGVDLSEADLRESNLNKADVRDAIFCDNLGLTKADREMLRNGGAIVQDSLNEVAIAQSFLHLPLD